MSTWRLTRNRKAYLDRHSQRYADIGRETEINVEQLLKKAVDVDKNPLFTEVIRHEPHSDDDNKGKDFTVTITKDGELYTRSFGITISLKSCHESQQKHPHIVQLHLDLNIKPETIIKKVVKLFDIETSQTSAL